MLNKIRSLFNSHGIQGYIVPSSDEFQNEYVLEENNRLQFITQFSGSNGILVILQEVGLFFTDGRYLEQAARTLDAQLYEIHNIWSLRSFDWSKYLKAGDAIGYDPMLFTAKQLEIFASLATLPIETNLVDQIAEKSANQYKHDIRIYSAQYCQQAAVDKLINLRKNIKDKQAYFISDTSSICWMLNLRDFGPSTVGMFDCYFLVNATDAFLFTDAKLSAQVIDYLGTLQITTLQVRSIYTAFNDYAQIKVDRATCSLGILKLMPNQAHEASYKTWQAIKDPLQIDCSIKLHIEDGAALCEFFAWLEQAQNADECDLADAIINFRQKSALYIKESFHAICGFGQNSSIIHYRAIKSSARKIQGDGLLLVDTGGHYFGGTTDVTRVISLGNPSDQHKLAYTLVLKGHINLASSIFAQNASGQNLDALARQFLWQHKMDYPHSTGHGVGNFLNVHEGPGGISANNNFPLQAGMIVSNEPGYYKAGEFGIRIENLMYVKDLNDGFYAFENLTLLPFEAKLIDANMLTELEKSFIIKYYSNIRLHVMPKLSIIAQDWLERQLCAINF